MGRLYTTCKLCGANLDFGERCDCTRDGCENRENERSPPESAHAAAHAAIGAALGERSEADAGPWTRWLRRHGRR